MSLFGGLVPTHHFLYDKSATGHLTSSWSLLIPGTSFSMHLCIDWGLTRRLVFQHASPPCSSLLWLSFPLPSLPWMLVHPRCLHRLISCWTAMYWPWLRVIITFVSSRETRCSFPFSRRVMPWSSLCSVVRALLCPCLYQVVQCHTQVRHCSYWGTLVPQFLIHLPREVGLL